MDKKFIASIAFAAILLVGITSTQALPSLYNAEEKEVKIQERMEAVFADVDIEEMKASVADDMPSSRDEAKTAIEGDSDESAPSVGGGGHGYPYYDGPQRFILWSHDGENVMWGTYGNGYFEGETSNGDEVWGIYQDHKFAGFKGDDFFFGKLWNGRWVAEGLFSNGYEYGNYELFPQWRGYTKPIPVRPYGYAVDGVSPEQPQPYEYDAEEIPLQGHRMNTLKTLMQQKEVPIGPFEDGTYW